MPRAGLASRARVAESTIPRGGPSGLGAGRRPLAVGRAPRALCIARHDSTMGLSGRPAPCPDSMRASCRRRPGLCRGRGSVLRPRGRGPGCYGHATGRARASDLFESAREQRTTLARGAHVLCRKAGVCHLCRQPPWRRPSGNLASGGAGRTAAIDRPLAHEVFPPSLRGLSGVGGHRARRGRRRRTRGTDSIRLGTGARPAGWGAAKEASRGSTTGAATEPTVAASGAERALALPRALLEPPGASIRGGQPCVSRAARSLPALAWG